MSPTWNLGGYNKTTFSFQFIKTSLSYLQVPSVFSAPMRLHASNPNLSTIDFVEEKNYSDGSETSSEFTKMQEDLFHVAHKGK